MKNGVYSILKARFLINEEANAAKNWRFIVFLILLAIIMIANNNNVDQKVFKIVQLSGEVTASVPPVKVIIKKKEEKGFFKNLW
jgi:hypothetical protein